MEFVDCDGAEVARRWRAGIWPLDGPGVPALATYERHLDGRHLPGNAVTSSASGARAFGHCHDGGVRRDESTASASLDRDGSQVACRWRTRVGPLDGPRATTRPADERELDFPANGRHGLGNAVTGAAGRAGAIRFSHRRILEGRNPNDWVGKFLTVDHATNGDLFRFEHPRNEVGGGVQEILLAEQNVQNIQSFATCFGVSNSPLLQPDPAHTYVLTMGSRKKLPKPKRRKAARK